MITGSMLRDAVVSASHHINNHRGDVDALNVFPVPDGDTGTNMSMTIGAAAPGGFPHGKRGRRAKLPRRLPPRSCAEQGAIPG